MRNKAQKQQLPTCLEIKNKKKPFNTLQTIFVILLLSVYAWQECMPLSQRHPWPSQGHLELVLSHLSWDLVQHLGLQAAEPSYQPEQLQQQLCNIYFLKLHFFLPPKRLPLWKIIYFTYICFFHSFNIQKETETQAGLLARCHWVLSNFRYSDFCIILNKFLRW